MIAGILCNLPRLGGTIKRRPLDDEDAVLLLAMVMFYG